MKRWFFFIAMMIFMMSAMVEAETVDAEDAQQIIREPISSIR